MSALQDFDSVGYRTRRRSSVADAHVAAAREELGPDYLTVDLGVYASQDGDLRFAL
jgi:hypothetical protein